MSALDPRSEFVFDVHELGRRPGRSKQMTRVVEAPDGIGIAVIGVPARSPIRLEMLFESVVEGVWATGAAEVQLRGECSRCLEDVEAGLAVELQDLYLYPGKESDDEQAARVEGDLIDIEPLLRDQVVLELPFAPLCRPDCAGLCPQCGANLNRDPDHSHPAGADPRWSALAGLIEDIEE
ncbi:MAG: DUF177 domain-containing protein [Propionibacteriaceae bacterium]|jgi:uncharacterized protein|nr:DUF177 domain-containing protein [Propionibacteriaceae bacterium]